MNVVVIFGGESCEHDISIITGEQLISNMDEYLYKIYPIYIDKNGTWFTGEQLKDIDVFSGELKKIRRCSFVPNDNTLYVQKNGKYKKLVSIDMAFVCLHGQRGEDGSVASILELSKIPYSSASICASSVCMDKCVFKNFAKGIGVNVVEGIELTYYEYVAKFEEVEERISDIGYPVIIKPSRLGSSIGIEVCDSKINLEEKLKNAFKFDKKLLIEKFVDVNKEVNIALFENKGEFVVSNTEEPVGSDKILSFDNKYRKNAGGFETIKRIMPARISEEQYDYIKSTAIMLYSKLEMFGVVRFDFLISKNGEIYVNEVNTIPGSMANYLFDKEKYGYPKLINMMISNALIRKEMQLSVSKIFDSGVLTNDFDGFKK